MVIQHQIYHPNPNRESDHPGLVSHSTLDRMRADYHIVLTQARKVHRNRDRDFLILQIKNAEKFPTFDVDGLGIQGVIKRAAFQF